MLTTNRTHRLQMDEVTTEGHIDNRKKKGNAQRHEYNRAKRQWRGGGISTTEVHTERHTTAKVTFEGHIE